MATVPRLGTTVLEQFINVKKNIQTIKREFSRPVLVHCFLKPSILGVSSVVLVHDLETIEFLGTEVKTLWMTPKFPFLS